MQNWMDKSQKYSECTDEHSDNHPRKAERNKLQTSAGMARYKGEDKKADSLTAVVEKIARLRAMIGGRPIDIEVDGGITPETAPMVTAAGANVLVAGSAIFKGGVSGYRGNIAAIRHAGALARGEAA